MKHAFLLLVSASLASCSHVSLRPSLATGHEPVPSNLPNELRRTVCVLSQDIGERNCYRREGLLRASDWIESQLRSFGLTPQRESFQLKGETFKCPDQVVWNIFAEVRGTSKPEEIVAVGGHYDSRGGHVGWHDHDRVVPGQRGTPGANDNGSGVAGTLALARYFVNHPQARTLRFYFWVNEEPPFYQTDSMGSVVSARRANESRLRAVISIDTAGCYSPQSRHKREDDFGKLPELLGLPSDTSYAAFLGVNPNASLMKRCANVFSAHSRTPLRSLTLPYLDKTVAWSDDWSYRMEGVPSFCVNDTAFLRSDHYHELSDTVDHMDFVPFADVVWGLRYVMEDLASR